MRAESSTDGKVKRTGASFAASAFGGGELRLGTFNTARPGSIRVDFDNIVVRRY